MTLNDIIVAAMAQLDRGQDSHNVEIYRNRLTQYANEAQNDLALELGPRRTERVTPNMGVIDTRRLARRCVRVERVRQLDHDVPFSRGSTPEMLLLPYTSEAEVTYRFLPQPLEHADDVSELDDYLHPLIVNYVVGRERMGGDVTTQRGGNIYLSMYNAAKAKLRGWLGDEDSQRIVNRY